MKTTNNATIFEQIKTRGYMTEREMLLLKSRSNVRPHFAGQQQAHDG